MSLAQRLRRQMRWRGIKSQNQLARLSGVPQSCIHRILTRTDDYAPDRRTLLRLAQALNTTVPWLTDGVTPATPVIDAPPPLRDHALPNDGYCAEICALLQPHSDNTKKQILAIIRFIINGPRSLI